MRTLALLTVLSSSVLAQSNRTACSLTPEVEKEYLTLPSMSDLSLSWEERYAPRRDLAKKYPTDWPLQFTVQQPIVHHSEMGREWDLALSYYRSLPDRHLGELLEARLLSPLHRKKSHEVLDKMLSQAQDSPWTHLAVLEWAAERRSGDPALAAQEFEELRGRCPGNLLAFQYLGSVRDPQKLRGHVTALRNAIEAKKKLGLDESEVELFRTAWTWERVTYGESRLDEFKRAVRADVEFLREHLNYDSWPWVFMVSHGYTEILKDSVPVKTIADEVLRRAPNGQAAWWIKKERWEEQNPPPKQTPPQPNQPIPPSDVAASEAYGKLYTDFMLSLMEQFWGKPYAAFEADHLMAAQNLPDGAFERLADLVLSNSERFPDQSTSTPPVQIQVAEQYVQNKVRLDRVPSLVQQGLKQVDNQEKYFRDSDAFDKMALSSGTDDFTRRRAREILIRHAIVTQQKERTLALLSDFRRELDQAKPADTTGRAGSSWRSDQMSYSMLARQAGLDVSIADIAISHPEEPERYPVPEFEAKDLSGKSWSIADLQGKVTYVLLWRTGCGGSCHPILSGVQQLYEHWKNRMDRAVLTISEDENPGIAQSIMKENGYSFPVICGVGIAEKFVPGGGYPQEALIDPQGRRSRRHPPRASDETIGKIEEIADKIGIIQ
jgi:AhpC/TSA family